MQEQLPFDANTLEIPEIPQHQESINNTAAIGALALNGNISLTINDMDVQTNVAPVNAFKETPIRKPYKPASTLPAAAEGVNTNKLEDYGIGIDAMRQLKSDITSKADVIYKDAANAAAAKEFEDRVILERLAEEDRPKSRKKKNVWSMPAHL